MKPAEFLNELADDKIVSAIAAAEARTSGEIRIFISHHKIADPLDAVQKEFIRLKMDRTSERNAVLIFVAPKSNKFAIVGDIAVHGRCGQAFWDEIAAAMTTHFKQGQWTEGIVHAIQRAADLLAEHFPRRSDDVNELPDKVERD